MKACPGHLGFLDYSLALFASVYDLNTSSATALNLHQDLPTKPVPSYSRSHRRAAAAGLLPGESCERRPKKCSAVPSGQGTHILNALFLLLHYRYTGFKCW